MARITRKNLVALVGALRRQTGDSSYYIGEAYGQCRLERICNGGGCEDVSPRLPSGQLYEWMHAFLKGFHTARKNGG